MERVEGAFQEHAKEILQVEGEFAKISAGTGGMEITTRRKKMMEHEMCSGGGGGSDVSSPPSIMVNGWVHWDKKMETRTHNAVARNKTKSNH